ncbi:hypothetical protein MBANPS3_001285 [Mucor bainieri]
MESSLATTRHRINLTDSISSNHVSKYRLDKILTGLKYEDWINPEAVADHFVNIYKEKKQRPNGDRLYAKYTSAIRLVANVYNGNASARLYAKDIGPYIQGNLQFKNILIQRYDTNIPVSSKRSASTMLEEEGGGEEEEEEESVQMQEITPSEASEKILQSEMSIDGASQAILSQTPPPRLTFGAVKKAMFDRAKDYFTLYKARKSSLTGEQRRLMSCGASLILDLVDIIGRNDFVNLFTSIQWETLKTKFNQDFRMQDVTWSNESLKNNWTAAVSLISSAEMFAASQRYLHDILKDPMDTRLKDAYQLMLALFDRCQYIQRTNFSVKDASEYDIAYKVWLPVLLALFSESTIDVKLGETINSDTTEHKMLLFPDETKIYGFKTDVRFIATVDGTFDLASGESCLSQPVGTKIVDDHAKLLREGKVTAMSLYKATDAAITHAWTVQFIGLQAIFCTVSYADYDLYIATHQETIHFPTSVTDFKDTNAIKKFIDTLLKFQRDLFETATIIKDTIQRVDQSQSYEAPLPFQTAPSARSFFTPPKEDLSRARFPVSNQEALASGAEDLIQVDQREATSTTQG